MTAKDKALEKAAEGQKLLRDRWREFREESPYFQAKVGMVVAWIAITLLTIIIAPPTPASFIVEQKVLSFGLAEKTALIIANQAGGDLETAIVEVQGTQTDFDGKKQGGSWSTKETAILQGMKTTLSTESFFDKKGINPGYQLHIDQVTITENGDVVWSGPPGPGKR